MKILANEFVLPMRDGFECHASHFLTLRDGGVYCVYFYGTKEGNDDVRIFASRRRAGGVWSDPVPVTEDDGLPHWNPVLHRRKDGAVVLFYKVGKKIRDWVTYCKISYDDCNTWSEAVPMIRGDDSGGRGPVRNKILECADGTLLAPASTERGEWKCFFDRSTDDGKTWERGEDLTLPDSVRMTHETMHRRGIIQPTLWESETGIHALMRSTEGCIYRTDSGDGIRFSAPYAIDVPNNNSGIDLVRIPDGRIFLALNPVSDNWGARTPISLYVSEDDGKTFAFYSHLTTMEGRYAYPAMRYENGCLHLMYTWNRKTLQYFCFSEL